MKITNEELDEIRAANPILDYVHQYSHSPLKRLTATEYAGPCIVCGGRDRFHVDIDSEQASCRKCHGMNKWFDVIGLEQIRTGCNFQTAIENLRSRPQMRPRLVARLRGARLGNEQPSQQWQREAGIEVKKAMTSIEREEGKLAREYLSSRGLHRSTCQAWSLGCSNDANGSICITMPWIDGKGMITALKYRRISNVPKDQRFFQKKGGTQSLYGLHQFDPNATLLVVVEGEFNALSIWQELQHLDRAVVSIGSQTMGQLAFDSLAHLAQQFEQVAVWCDEEVQVQKIMSVLHRRVIGIKSPFGLDANSLLQSGQLRRFMERQLAKGR